MFNDTKRRRIFISIRGKKIGGGANTFARNFSKWLAAHRDEFVEERYIHRASLAIVIANKVDEKKLVLAKSKGCFVIHRLDEHVERGEDDNRRKKHEQIRRINQLADVTVYQSEFVRQNMHPYLFQPKNTEVIRNGGDQEEFFPTTSIGPYIGHVTWGVGHKKRLDLLHSLICERPDVQFLLVGNHVKSGIGFHRLPNVRYVGPIRRSHLLRYLHQMKWLFFPSENDPCPNTVVEALLAGLPVCFNEVGGTRELVGDCGLPLDRVGEMDDNLNWMRSRLKERTDLSFDAVARSYLALCPSS